MIVRVVVGVVIGVCLGALMGYYGQCSSGTCPLTANPIRGAIYGGVMGALFAFSFAHSARRQNDDNKNAESSIVASQGEIKSEKKDADL